MFDESSLFDERDTKDETLTIRLTKRQKDRIGFLAKRKGLSASKFIMALVGEENQRHINESHFNLCEDGMPF